MVGTTGHIIFLGNGSWPDTKQLCVFAGKVVQFRSLDVTIFTNPDVLERAKREVRGEVDDASLATRIRVAALPSQHLNHLVDPTFDTAFVDVYEKLVAGQSFRCAVTDQEYGSAPAPCTIISSNFTADMLKKLRDRSQRPVKMLAWYSHPPSTLFFFHGPMERGGVSDLRTRLHEEAKRLNKPEEEVLEETVRFLGSILIRIPGYEPIYSHEIQPQELIRHGSLGVEWLTIYDMFMACDGVLMSTPECYDPLAFIGSRAWMAETSRNIFAVGPAILTSAKAIETELKHVDKGSKIGEFISKILKSHGPGSLLYISFGTQMWPKDASKLWMFLDAVMDLGIPFILSQASEFADVPQEIRDKVDRYGLGLLSSWCPQQAILNHPATGCFVTHCGHGSVMEAINAGIPMVCWPFVGDEALNAIYVTDTLKIGYELMQIRTGHGMERIFRTALRPEGTAEAIHTETVQVLRRAFGEDGAKKKANLTRLREKFSRVWEEHGESRRAMAAFLEEVGV